MEERLEILEQRVQELWDFMHTNFALIQSAYLIVNREVNTVLKNDDANINARACLALENTEINSSVIDDLIIAITPTDMNEGEEE